MIRIRRATLSDLASANAFYKSCGATGRVEPGDRVLLAEVNSRIVGTVRLCAEQGLLVLRSMRVRDDQQRQGVGRALLAAAREWIGEAECFCLPFSHLERFYGTAGFVRVPANALPDHLQRRMADYLGRGLDVIGMRRARIAPHESTHQR